MDAGTLSIRDIFGHDRRHVVPLFQRPYVWTREVQWEPFWDDIRSVAERLLQNGATRPHFLGAIVLDQLRKPTGHLETRLVIDGQQRLTTIQLFLEAFCDICAEQKIDDYYRALLKLTRNDDPLSKDVDEKFKVWPTNVDQEHFRRVMLVGGPFELRKEYGKKPTAAEVDHPIGDAYLFFHGEIAAWLRPAEDGFPERLDALYTAFREHIRMVVIDLGKEDDAQLIFETLNARGTPLLPSDLVKNSLFHRAQIEHENLDKLYGEYWKPFDEKTKYWRAELGRGHARRARIDIFLHHYLTLKTGEELSVANLYTAFRDYMFDGKVASARAMLESLREYAAVYQSFDEMPQGTREAVFFYRLAMMEITTAYPFLMELFMRLHGDEGEIRGVLTDLESFLVRRMVCQLNTRGYNKLFIDLIGALNGEGGTPLTRVRTHLASSEAESNRWPKDEEFLTAWLDVAVFKTLARQRVRMLLEALEMEMHTVKTEKLQFGEKLTIEHLMPQQWKACWSLPDDVPAMEAQVRRERLIHTLGNLTLLTQSLNSDVSNGPWPDKIKDILEHSALNMNRKLQDICKWNEDRITKRGESLFAVAGKIWTRPEA